MRMQRSHLTQTILPMRIGSPSGPLIITSLAELARPVWNLESSSMPNDYFSQARYRQHRRGVLIAGIMCRRGAMCISGAAVM